MDNTNPIEGLEPISETKVSPSTGISAIALNMALKYHGINTVQDGALYQQYKLEGKNMRELHLEHVFETAMKMEVFLLGASDRIAQMVVEAISTNHETDYTATSPIPGSTTGDER